MKHFVRVLALSVIIQSETFRPCIGFISDKYRVSQKLLNNGEHYTVDFPVQTMLTPYRCVLSRQEAICVPRLLAVFLRHPV